MRTLKQFYLKFLFVYKSQGLFYVLRRVFSKIIEKSFLKKKEPLTTNINTLNVHKLYNFSEALLSAGGRKVDLVSIVIPVWNNVHLTLNCIQSLYSAKSNTTFEVLIVNNGSIDDTSEKVAHLAGEFPNLRLINLETNYGFSIGCNVGAYHSRGSKIIFLNNDTLVSDHWMDHLIETLLSDEDVGITGPKLLYEDKTLQSGGMVFSSFSKIPYNIYSCFDGSKPEVNKRRNFAALTGACIAIRAHDFLRLNGFDIRFLNGSEDIDLCLRISSQLRKSIVFVPQSVVIHLESKTEGRFKHISRNRKLLVDCWRQSIVPDDFKYYFHDGYRIKNYISHEIGSDEDLLVKTPVIEKFTSDSPLSILVVKPSGIGNMIMALPALQLLRKHFPQAKISIACYEAESKVLGDTVDEIFLLSKDPKTGGCRINELEEICRNNFFDAALYPPFSNISRPTRVLQELIPVHLMHPNIDFENVHEVDHNLNIIRQLGIDDPIPQNIELVECVYDGFDISSPYMCIHAGSSNSVHMRKKRWSAENYAHVVAQLASDIRIVLLGGEEDLLDAEKISENCSEKVVNLCGKLTLDQSIFLIRHSKGMLSNDSGLMHIASALGKPVVALFGPTLTSKNGPWGMGDHKIIQSTAKCSPCYARPEVLFSCPDAICMKMISIDEVVAATRKVIL